MDRYLTVFSLKGWQVIDTHAECTVIGTGSKEEMLTLAAKMSEDNS